MLLAGCLGRVEGYIGDEEAAYVVRSRAHTFDWPVDISATIVGGGYVDPETPVTLEIELENRTDDVLSYSWPNWQVQPDDRHEFFLTDTSISGDLIDFVDGCWVLMDPERLYPVRRIGRSLDAGATNRRSVILVSNRQSRSPPEDITFSVPIMAHHETHEWGFRLLR